MVDADRARRSERVRAVLAASARLADPRDPLGAEARRLLPAVTGLSPSGVELALSSHVERHIDDHALHLLLERQPTVPRVHVVLSANVFVGATRALAMATAGAPSVALRPSRREPTYARLLVQALAEDSPWVGIRQVSAVSPRAGDEVHAYGGLVALSEMERALPAGCAFRGHGPGYGIALISASDDLAMGAEALANDVVPFDQRGCLSPRIAFVIGPSSRGGHFARGLIDALIARQQAVPRGRLSSGELEELRRYEDTVAVIGELMRDEAGSVGHDPLGGAFFLPPPGRHVHIVSVPDIASISRLLAPFVPFITSAGVISSAIFAPFLRDFASGARIAQLGRMQNPPLDGPVDLRGLTPPTTSSHHPSV